MYALIHQNEIKVGPRNWHTNIFKNYLTENNLPTNIPLSDPGGPFISAYFKILPVYITEPGYNSLFEQLVGPTLTIENDKVTGSFTVTDQPFEQIKGKLASIIVDNRYKKEIGGVDHIIAGDTVRLDTSRDGRLVYSNLKMSLPTDGTVSFKFSSSITKTLNADDLTQINTTVFNHVQNCFAWEASKLAELAACTIIDQLKVVDLNAS